MSTSQVRNPLHRGRGCRSAPAVEPARASRRLLAVSSVPETPKQRMSIRLPLRDLVGPHEREEREGEEGRGRGPAGRRLVREEPEEHEAGAAHRSTGVPGEPLRARIHDVARRVVNEGLDHAHFLKTPVDRRLCMFCSWPGSRLGWTWVNP